VKHEFQAGRKLDTSERIFTVYPLALVDRYGIGRNAKLLLTLTFKKKAPQSGVRLWGNGFIYGFFLGGEHDELCSVVDILPIWSDMSRRKMKLKMATQKQIQVSIICRLKYLYQ